MARRFDPDVAGFVAVKQPTQCAWADLRRLVGPGVLVMLSGGGDIDPPPTGRRVGGGFGNQMILDRLAPAPDRRQIEPLTAADVPADAGPRRTHPAGTVPTADDRTRRLLRGVRGRRTDRDGGRTAADAGVHRGQRRVHPPVGRGPVSPPRSHTVSRPASSPTARPRSCTWPRPMSGPAAVYERLGFVVRRELQFVAVETPAKRPSLDPTATSPESTAREVHRHPAAHQPAGSRHRTPGSATEVLGNAVEEAVVLRGVRLRRYGIGEHHIDDAEASSPAVILGYLAASTKRIRLFTGVTVLSLLDPVRVAEDYATVDVLSGGRVDLIIGKGTRKNNRRSSVTPTTISGNETARTTNCSTGCCARRRSRGTASIARARRLHVAPPAGPTADQGLARQRHVDPVDRSRRQWATRCSRRTSPDRSSSTGRSSTTTANGGSTTATIRPMPSSGPGSAGLHVHRDSQTRDRRVPPPLRGVSGFRAPTRRPGDVHLARGCDRPRVLLRGQPRPGGRPGAPLPRRARTRGPAHRRHRPARRSGHSRRIELFAAEVLPNLQRDIPDRLWDRLARPATTPSPPRPERNADDDHE